MKHKELTKTFMMISNIEKPLWSPWFMQKYVRALRDKLADWLSLPSYSISQVQIDLRL